MTAYNFPNSPSDGDTETANGITYTYSSSKTRWDAAAASGSSTTVYATIDLLPLSGASTGDQAYVSGNNRLYIWNGSGWYNIALINTTPSISGASSSYSLATDGTATTVTITATDPEGIPITYSIASDTSGNAATVTQGTGSNTNVFTITPTTNTANAGTFSLTFRASDGVNIATAVSEFTLSLSIANSNYTTALITSVGANNAVNNSFDDASTNNHTITANGSVTQNTFSPYRYGGYSTRLDGNGDTLTVPSTSTVAFGTGAFTVEAWVYIVSAGGAGGDRGVFQTGGSHFQTSSSNSVALTVSANKWSIYANNTSTQSAATYNLENKWYHVAVVRSASTTKLYVDGVEAISVSDSTNYTGTYLGIGAVYGAASAQCFNGYIRDFRVVKGTAVYTSAFTPLEDPLSAITNTSLLTCHLPYIADGSTNSHSITVNGDTKTAPFAPYEYLGYSSGTNGASMYFDGSGDSLYTPTHSSLTASGDFTVEMWIYPEQIANPAGQSPTFFAWAGANCMLYITASTGILNLYSSSSIITSTNAVKVNRWTHVALARQSGTTRMFLNGVLEGSSTTWSTNPSGRVVIGSEDPSGYEFGKGSIADVRLVNGTAVYTSAFTPPTAPLTAITNTSLLLNGTDSAIIDKSQSVKTITLNGDVKSSTAQTKHLTSSIYFDGTGDTLSLPDSTGFNFGSGDSTIEMWVYPLGTGTFNLMTRGASGYSGFILSSTGFLESTNAASWAANITFSTAITANAWQHVAAVRNGSTITIYRNGTSVGTASISGAVTSAAQSLVIGARAGQSNFQGYMSDIRITKGLARYTSNFTAPTAALQG